jgi:titin
VSVSGILLVEFTRNNLCPRRAVPEPEVIFLKHVERSKPHTPMPEPDRTYPPPQFVVPLQDIAQSEGGRIKFEARVEPNGDPTLIVEWFINGHPLTASKLPSLENSLLS